MPSKKKPKKDLLRERAEKRVSKRSDTLSKIENKDIKKLVHQLETHQIELEMQNEELRKAQAEIEESRGKFSDLYDFAPAGYFTLTTGTLIEEVNLTGACLLNIERRKLLHRPFSVFVEPSYRPVFSEYFLKAFKRGEEINTELKLLRKGKDTFDAYLSSISANYGSTVRVRTIITDVTQRKRAEEEIRRLNRELEERNVALKDSQERLRLLSSQLINIQEIERKRISIEIHDSLGQSLNAIKFRFQETIRQLEAEERHAVSKPLRNLIPVVQTAIEEARRIQMDLRPSMLDDLGILATLSWFLRQFQKTYVGIRVEEEIQIDENRLSIPLKTVIYRTLQEAMSNVAKHSGASLVQLSLVNSGRNVELTVQDNGKGFDLNKALSMEERHERNRPHKHAREDRAFGRPFFDPIGQRKGNNRPDDVARVIPSPPHSLKILALFVLNT